MATADVNVNKAFENDHSQLKILKKSLPECFRSATKKTFFNHWIQNQLKEQSENWRKLRHWIVVYMRYLFTQYWWNWIWIFILFWTKSSTNITLQQNGWAKISKNKFKVTDKIESKDIVKTGQF